MVRGRLCLVAWLVSSFSASLGAEEPATPSPVSKLKEAASAYRQGQFQRCAEASESAGKSVLLNPDAALFLEAQCRFYAGDRQKARDRFIQIKENHPRSPWANLASLRIEDCDFDLGELPLAQAELYEPLPYDEAIQSARRLYRQRNWDEALFVLDAIPEPVHEPDRFALAYLTGRILFDMPGKKEQAARLLYAARDHAPNPALAEDAWFWASRSLGRSGQEEAAIQSHLAMVEQYPKGPHASEALFYAGFLEQDRDALDPAISLFSRVLEQYGADRFASDARWYLAWCQLRAKRWEEAISTLAPQVENQTRQIGGRAIYWTGVAHQAQNRDSKAHSLWNLCLSRFPLSWYALLSSLRLGEDSVLPPAPAPATHFQTVSDPLLDRANELLDADLFSFADWILIQSEKEFLDRHPTTEGLLSLLHVYARAKDFHRAWFLAQNRGGSLLQRLPSTSVGRAVWDAAYPPCKREHLKTLSAGDSHLVLFWQSIMRAESAFDPQALSIADARGLMQLVPTTARRVALDKKVEFDPDRLFEEDYNIELATHLLRRLADKFHRQWPLVAASYNAGSGAAMKWCEKNGGLSLDFFVEAIPYFETRSYAQTVTENMARYAYLENQSPPVLSLQLDPKFLKDEIDY
jgi:soluble lytic murein transglycosylase